MLFDFREERFLDPIHRGMNFYILSQTNWWLGTAMQYGDASAAARTYEPQALLPRTTFANAMSLLKFYQYTGDKDSWIMCPSLYNGCKRTCCLNQ
jgi:hypothetical protein